MWPRVGLLLVASFLPFIKSQSPCTTPNGESAFCISIYDCEILLNAIRTRDSVQINFLRESQCGYVTDPLVCCGTANTYTSPQSPPRRPGNRPGRPGSGGNRPGGGGYRPGSGSGGNRPGSGSSRPGTGASQLPDRDTCGFQAPGRILDGEVTAIEEFPWMALLQYRKRSDGKLTFACGGSLISKKYVLTAAHCVTGQILTAVGPLVNVRLGEWNTDEEIDCLTSKGEQQCYDPPVDVPVEETIAHSEYNDQSIDRYNDIAIVRLSNEVTYSDTIAPICLPARSDKAAAGDIVVVAGWGRTESASRSAFKLKLKIPVFTQSQCARTFRAAGVTVAQSQLCAGGERGRDSCSGDSGGPLMNNFSNDSSQWYVEGVVSFGAKCGTEDWPGIYTRVNNYVDWIKSNVRA